MLASLAFAQTGTASLSGTVLDPSKAAIPGAQLLLRNEAQSLQRTATSKSKGEYTFASLPPGTYTLTVEKQGFRKYEQTGVILQVDSAATDSVTLELGSVTEQVEVNSQAVTINTTDASIGNAFTERQIAELPLESRNVPDLLSLQTGVVHAADLILAGPRY